MLVIFAFKAGSSFKTKILSIKLATSNCLIFPNSSLTFSPVKINEVDYTILIPDYERLNLLGYNYYGGYNPGYREYLQTTQANLYLA